MIREKPRYFFLLSVSAVEPNTVLLASDGGFKFVFLRRPFCFIR